MIENIQKFLKICNNTSMCLHIFYTTHISMCNNTHIFYKNMQKICKNPKYEKKFYFLLHLQFFLEVLSHQLYFKPNLYFYVKYANMKNSELYLSCSIGYTSSGGAVQPFYSCSGSNPSSGVWFSISFACVGQSCNAKQNRIAYSILTSELI